MKKMTTMLLVLVMIAGLAGCKTNTPAAEPEPTVEDTEQPADEEQPAQEIGRAHV